MFSNYFYKRHAEIPVAAKQASGEDESIAGLATGYITPQLRELVRAPRKQVVVVVTTDLRVICYDHNLRIVWEQDLRVRILLFAEASPPLLCCLSQLLRPPFVF